jgi:hypothetical protein
MNHVYLQQPQFCVQSNTLDRHRLRSVYVPHKLGVLLDQWSKITPALQVSMWLQIPYLLTKFKTPFFKG